MTDKELLELAAKAVGFDSCQVFIDGDIYCAVSYVKDGRQHISHWNPLTDDGDALRLAVDLGITVHICDLFNTTVIEIKHVAICEKHKNHKHAATRRAIVRAAAAIGAEL